MRFADIFTVVMKKNFLVLAFIIFGFSVFENNVFAQKQIEPQIQRDPILEADASHNLEVAQQYFECLRHLLVVPLFAENLRLLVKGQLALFRLGIFIDDEVEILQCARGVV